MARQHIGGVSFVWPQARRHVVAPSDGPAMQAQCQTARMKPFACGTRRPEGELDQRRWSAVLLDQLLFKLFETGSKKIGGWAQFGRCVLVLLCFPQICSAVQHAKKGCPLVRARMPGLEHRDGLTMLTDHFPFWSLGSRAALMASDKIRNPVPTVDDFLFNINLGRYQAISYPKNHLPKALPY